MLASVINRSLRRSDETANLPTFYYSATESNKSVFNKSAISRAFTVANRCSRWYSRAVHAAWETSPGENKNPYSAMTRISVGSKVLLSTTFNETFTFNALLFF